jgi:hypothetical protein
MQNCSRLSHRIARLLFLCILLGAGNAHADGFPEAAVVDDSPTETNFPHFGYVPPLDHHFIVLADGRVLAAGGMAVASVINSHKIGRDSEVWSPASGEWQMLGDALRFDANQKVYLGQLRDGRVLFFATREGDAAPEYQVRIWNIKDGTFEIPAINLRPKADTDIAVLDDGRVLIVDAEESSTEIWDSRTNTVKFAEQELLGSARWSLLPLKNNQVLLVETFFDTDASNENAEAAETGDELEKSVVLLWNTDTNECEEISLLPVLYRPSFKLGVAMDDSISVLDTQNWYRLPALDEEWQLRKLPKLRFDEPASGVSNTSSGPGKLDSEAAVLPEPAWWKLYAEAVGDDLKLMMMVFAVLGFVLVISLPSFFRKGRDANTEVFAQLMQYDREILLFVLVLVVGILLWHLPYPMMQEQIGLWRSQYPEELMVTGIVLAVTIPAGLYFALRRYEETGQLTRWLNWISRLFQLAGICFVLLSVWAMLGGYALNKMHEYLLECNQGAEDSSVRQTALDKNRQWVACLDQKNGMVESLFFSSTKEKIMALPAVPCRYVGTWKSTRPGTAYKVTLTDDSQFVAEPAAGNRSGTETYSDSSDFVPPRLVVGSRSGAESYSGSWGVVGDEMVWLYDEGVVWPPDINQIIPVNRNRFTLVEVNGTRTEFELIDAIKSNTCAY